MFLCLLSDIFLVLLGISRRLLDVRHFFLYRSVLVYNPFLLKTVKEGIKQPNGQHFLMCILFC